MAVYLKLIVEFLPTLKGSNWYRSHVVKILMLTPFQNYYALHRIPFEPSISKKEKVIWVENTLSWIGPIIAFLQNRILSSDKEEAQNLKR